MEKNEPKMNRYWWFGIIAVITLFALNWILFLVGKKTNELGDTFGVANTLFTGLAFVALYISIKQQNIDIKHQREDIDLQTQALTLQGDEMKEQNLTIKLQRFENTFFNMLNLHHEIVGQIDYKEHPFSLITPKNPRFLGRHAFQEAYNKLLRVEMSKHFEMVDILHKYNATTTVFQLGHYFRNLHQVITIVDEFIFNANDEQEDLKIKYKYVGIIRSQLSKYELIWLFYQSLTELGEGKLRPLIKKYTLFQNLNKHELPNPDHFDIYPESAFNLRKIVDDVPKVDESKQPE